MYCQWCGKELDELAIHHCGPADRPPAYCRRDGQALAPGAAACAVCGLPAGEKPVPVAVGAAVASAAATAAAPPETGSSVPSTGGPGPGQVPPSPAAAPRPAAPLVQTSTAPDRRGGALRACAAAASIAGLSSFFIPWFAFTVSRVVLPGFGYLNITGITAVEQFAWSWWTPPCPQLLLILFGTTTVLSLLGWWSRSTVIDGAVALVGAALSVFLVRWLWLLRHDFDTLTGFWLTAAAGFLVFLLAATSVLTDRSQ